MLAAGRDREVVGATADGSYTKRPDMLLYPADIVERVKRSVVSWHCSIERWHNPMALSTALRPDELDSMRKGFDIVLDIDAKFKFEHARAAAIAVCNFFADSGVKANVKFSGRRGFHIGVAAEALPERIDFKPVEHRYPEILHTLATFIKEKARDAVLEALIQEEGGIAALAGLAKDLSELTPWAFVDLESNWGNRHLFRMPYSLHEKTWLVSMPLRLFKLKGFVLASAKPAAVTATVPFLSNKPGEAGELLLTALDWAAKHREPEKPKPVRTRTARAPIPEERFAPCIKAILGGLGDGKKRSLFTLLTYMRAAGWPQEKIEERIKEWNSKNAAPLPTRMLTGQIKWHARQSRQLMPANCGSDLFYKSIGVCRPDQGCRKNPINYKLLSHGRNR